MPSTVSAVCRAGLALVSALARCWMIAAVFGAVMYALAANDQGRETLIEAATSTPAVLVWLLVVVATATSYALSRLRTDTTVFAQPGFDAVFARDAAPVLATLAAGFALAVWIGLAGGDALRADRGVQGVSGLLVFAAILWSFMARFMDVLSRSPKTAGDYMPLAGPFAAGVAGITGFALGLPAWAIALSCATGAIAGSAVSARRDVRLGLVAEPQLAVVVGFGGFFAAYGVFAMWNHAEDPVLRIGTEAGPLLTLMLVLSGWLGVAFFCVLAWELVSRIERSSIRRVSRVAGVVLAIAALVAFLTGPYNQAEVRAVAEAASAMAATPPRGVSTLEAHVERWLDRRSTAIATEHKIYPVIFVAAEGGGIRAAYWTATVLGALHDAVPGFSDHVFAVSGVSGGSVGASVYAALVHQSLIPVPADSTAPPPCAKTNELAECAHRVLSADLLSAPLFGTLVVDVLRSAFRSDRWPDRARVLDGVLAASWNKATQTDQMALPFSSLWGDPAVAPRVPLLMPNATSASDGRRTVLSAFSGVVRAPSEARWLADSGSLSLATATLVSARFPFLSPTAVVTDRDGVERLVDGGYSDNSGAATTLELMREFFRIAERRNLACRLQPVALLVRSAPHASGAATTTGGVRGRVAGTLLDPVMTLDQVRAQLAGRYARELEAYTAANGGVFESRTQLNQAYALGWMLSSVTLKRIDAQRRQTISEVRRDLTLLVSGTAPAADRAPCPQVPPVFPRLRVVPRGTPPFGIFRPRRRRFAEASNRRTTTFGRDVRRFRARALAPILHRMAMTQREALR